MTPHDEERVQTLHPDPRKSGPRILAWKYAAVRRAILGALPREGSGLPFKDLNDVVGRALTQDESEALGSLPWYVVTVKLDMEARGEISRVPGARPQRLIRAS